MKKIINIIINYNKSLLMSNNTYLFIIDSTFISKYCLKNSTKYKLNKYDYLPIINTSGNIITELINSKFLIYLKCVKETKSTKAGYFGYFDGEEILINKKISKNINNVNENIIIDDLLYKNMIQNYSLCEVPNLIFVKYNLIVPFNTLITPTNFKEICNKNNLNCGTFSPKLNCLNIVKYKIDDFIKYIEELEEDKTENEETENEETENEEFEEDNTEMTQMDIPILWIPCNKILEKMENLKIKKNDIIYHYKECETCEIVDNNRKLLEITNKKINFHIKENEEDKEFIDKIIDFYQIAKKYIEKKELFENFGLEEDKINIIFYKNIGEIYDESFFIISK